MSNGLVDTLLEDLEQVHAELEQANGKIGQLELIREYTARAVQQDTGNLIILSEQFEIPLQIKGIAIMEGTFNGIAYTWGELQKSYKSLENCPITVDHPIDSSDAKLAVRDEVGRITSVGLDQEAKAVLYKGFIVDEGIARRIYHGLVDTNSIGAVMDLEKRQDGEAVGIRFLELSVVKRPACKGAKIEVLAKLCNGGFSELGDNGTVPINSETSSIDSTTLKEPLKEAPQEILRVPTHGVSPKADMNLSWGLTSGERNALPDSAFAWIHPDYPTKSQNKGLRKLPHHKNIGGTVKVVWRGVAAAMAALLGARDGVDIPSANKRSVYGHLVTHYKQFDKEPPEFRLEKLGGNEMTNEEQAEKPKQETEKKVATLTEELEPIVKAVSALSDKLDKLSEQFASLLEKAEAEPEKPESKPEEPAKEPPKEAPKEEPAQTQEEPKKPEAKELEILKQRIEKLESLPARVSAETGETKKEVLVTNEDICAWLKSKETG